VSFWEEAVSSEQWARSRSGRRLLKMTIAVPEGRVSESSAFAEVAQSSRLPAGNAERFATSAKAKAFAYCSLLTSPIACHAAPQAFCSPDSRA
jgi:hypothetical protein